MDAFKKILLKTDFEDILGQERVKKQVKSALLMDRHIVLVGPPGIGKTTLAKNIAKLFPPLMVNDCPYHCDPKDPVCPECRQKKKVKTKKIEGPERYVRIQGSPDLAAEDLIGDIDPIKALKYGPMDIRSFTPGKIFKANNKVLFFDELNRCSEKLQNALLQVLEEKKATISSYDIDLRADFIFVGTMNPHDTSTEPLSDVFLDRFDLIYMEYPDTQAIERNIVLKNGKSKVKFPEALLGKMIHFVRRLRLNDQLEKAPSVRATIGLYERAQANALLAGKEKVAFEHIKDAVYSVLVHRIRLKPNVKYLQRPEEIIQKELENFSEEKGDGP